MVGKGEPVGWFKTEKGLLQFDAMSVGLSVADRDLFESQHPRQVEKRESVLNGQIAEERTGPRRRCQLCQYSARSIERREAVFIEADDDHFLCLFTLREYGVTGRVLPFALTGSLGHDKPDA